ncbi:MAG TPA: phosphatase domain-containing protein [Gemmatimonadales bacterium]|nr:phosphatase domain-containing protein [Gemmatimonadales bacterium]
MADWRKELRELAATLGSHLGLGVSALERLVDPDPYHVVGYRGYAGPGRILVLGRVLEHEGLVTPEPGHSKFRNLLAMVKRLESDPLPFAKVRAQVAGQVVDLTADDEGFFRQWVAVGSLQQEGWGLVQLELLNPPDERPARAEGPFLVPSASASFGVISDMDDTVVQSQVTNFLRAARIVLLENARTRLPFPGVAAFYRALQDGPSGNGRNPIFYVSSSPWNLYDVISDFLDAQGIPAGPLLLRDWDLSRSLLKNAGHKTEVITEILATYPFLPFILVGDSGQEDPEIYAELVAAYPRRILAVYIRNVRPHPERSDAIRKLAARVTEAGSTLVLADDSLAAARHAAVHGWIKSEALADIGEEKRADEGSGAKADAPGVETEPAPTVVVDRDIKATELE